MKEKYPMGGFNVVAQTASCKNEPCYYILNGDIKTPLYPVKASALTRTVGYAQAENGEYLAIKKSNLPLLLIYLAIGALIIAAILIGTSRCSRDTKPGNAQTPVIESSIVLPDELTTVEHLDTKNKSIDIPGVPTLYFTADTKSQTHVFSNPENNPCYFKIQIILDDTQKTIYESELIPPGYSVQLLTLKSPLKTGTYKATIKYLTYSFDKEMNELNNAVVKTDIIVK